MTKASGATKALGSDKGIARVLDATKKYEEQRIEAHGTS